MPTNNSGGLVTCDACHEHVDAEWTIIDSNFEKPSFRGLLE